MIDLHLHLDGSLRPETAWELFYDKGIFDSLESVRKSFSVSDDCTDLNEYLKCFDYPLMLLQKEDNIVRAVKELGEDLAKEGTDYTEIRFAPMFSTKEGLSMEAVTEAAIEGAVQAENETGIRLNLILCCMRGASLKDNLDTVDCAKKYLNNKVCALDLAGAEGIFATSLYEEVFKKAGRLDIPFTIHAGEAAGPESIWTAVNFGASRIGHGIRSIEDERLVEYLAGHEIPIEVCPISNMQTKVYDDIKKYPLKRLLDNGVHATLNTDNRTVSNTCLLKERSFVKDKLGLTDRDIELMEDYSKKAAFNIG